MAAMTLTAWIAAHPDYGKYQGIVSGKPMLYQAAPAGAPVLTADSWYVWDYASSFVDLTQSPTTVDISTTGSTDRNLIPGVPDAPSPSDVQIWLGVDTDSALDAIDEIIAANQAAISGGERFYLCNFLGLGKRSEIFEANVTHNSGLVGAFSEAVSTNISVTPNLGAYHKFQIITAGP